MPSSVLPRGHTHRGALFWLVVVAVGVLWLVIGLIGREPWKADEAYSVAIVHGMAVQQHWWVPTLAGEAFVEKPPLIFWLAAGSARLLDGWLPLHEAARLVNVLCALLTLGLTYRATREAFDRATAVSAALLLALCPAFFAGTRYMVADLGLLPAAALVMWGFVRLQAGRAGAGPLIGVGLAVGLLSKGILLPAVTALTALLLWVVAVPTARAGIAHALGRAALVGALLSLPWPMRLLWESPALFWTWFWDNNFGRFLGTNDLGPPSNHWSMLGVVAALTLPAWPLATAYLWSRRAASWRADPLLGPAVFASIWMLVLLVSATVRGVYALPMLVPLAMMGGAPMLALGVWLQPRWPGSLVRAGRALLIGLAGAAVGAGIWALVRAGFGGDSAAVRPAWMLIAVAGVCLLGGLRGLRLGPAWDPPGGR